MEYALSRPIRTILNYIHDHDEQGGQSLLVRFDASSTTAEWHTLVRTVLHVTEGNVSFLDLSQAFGALRTKPTPAQILDAVFAAVGVNYLNCIMIATERTFDSLRKVGAEELCTEDGAILPNEISQEIDILFIDHVLEEGEGLAYAYADADAARSAEAVSDTLASLSIGHSYAEGPGDATAPIGGTQAARRNPFHTYIPLRYSSDCSLFMSAVANMELGNMLLEDMADVTDGDEY